MMRKDDKAKKPSCIIGVDVAKFKIDVYDTASGKSKTIPNTKAGISKWVKGLPGDAFVVMEATGGHERLCALECLNSGLAAHIADTFKVKSFIRSLGVKAKTDKIDAELIARYGSERYSELRLAEITREQLERKDLLSYWAFLKKHRASEKNRLESVASPVVKEYIKNSVTDLTNVIKLIESAIEERIKRDALLRKKYILMTSFNGIGTTTAFEILANFPELGSLSKSRAVALAGLAPYANESGQTVKARHLRGGRPKLRACFYMAAISAHRFNKTCATVFDRLVKRGKPKIVALIAVARKLVVQLNAILASANAHSEITLGKEIANV